MVEKGLAVLPDVLPLRTRRVPVEPTSLEKAASGLLRHPRGDVAEDPLHHGQVLYAGVSVEHHEAHGELENDAADTPDVAGLIPA